MQTPRQAPIQAFELVILRQYASPSTSHLATYNMLFRDFLGFAAIGRYILIEF